MENARFWASLEMSQYGSIRNINYSNVSDSKHFGDWRRYSWASEEGIVHNFWVLDTSKPMSVCIHTLSRQSTGLMPHEFKQSSRINAPECHHPRISHQITRGRTSNSLRDLLHPTLISALYHFETSTSTLILMIVLRGSQIHTSTCMWSLDDGTATSLFICVARKCDLP
jgi:hypothetical protein